MKLSFYPGCSLEGLANDHAQSISAVFHALGIELFEIEDWSCCGATAAHSLSEAMSVALPARNLAIAEKMGLDIVVPCANCFNRLRYSQQMIRKRIVDIPWSLTGDVQIHDITRFLADPEMLKRIRERVHRPLNKLKVVCYYGCQMVRHPSITGFNDYENPRTLDLLVSEAGAQTIDWSYKSTCCGAGIGIGRRDIQQTLTRKILDKARQAGAEAVVVSCPLCQSNLDFFQKDMREASLPVFYFTELLRLAFEEEPDPRLFKRHLTDPVRLLAAKGLV
jgi:heterodisulfide reductase subunit B